jgi:hypothetical protein
MQNHHLQSKDMDRDGENGQLKVSRECRTITYILRIQIEIVKMVSSKVGRNAQP